MMKARYFFGFILLYLSVISSAQSTVYFTYDHAGNRETRSINLSPLNSTFSESSASKEVEDIKFEENFGEGKRIIFFPNPTQGILKIEIQGYSAEEVAIVTLHTITGILLINRRIYLTDILDLTEYQNATYILKIIIDDNCSEWKIIKE
jgi:hypothetical protein